MRQHLFLVLIALVAATTAFADGRLSWHRAPNGEFVLVPAAGADPADVYQNMKQIAATDGVGMCGGITATADRNDCFKKVAEVADQPDICGRIGTASVPSTEATGDCFAVLGVKKADRSLCDRIPTDAPFSRNNCLQGVAVKKRDVRLCEEMTSKGIPGDMDCLREVIHRAGNRSMCERLTKAGLKDSCYQEMAEELSDSSFCDRVGKPWSRDFCFEKLAQRLGDWSLCDRIQNASVQSSCTRALRAQDLGEESFCADLGTSDSIAECYTNLALRRNDAALCEKAKVEDPTAGTIRPSSQPIKVTDVNPWLASQEYRFRDSCYQRMAEKRLDAELCMKVVRPSKRDRCFDSLASLKQEADLCVPITDQGMRDRCVYKVALFKKDPQLCQRIQDPQLRQECLEQAGKWEPELQRIPDTGTPPGAESVGPTTWEPFSETVPKAVYEQCLAKAVEFTKKCDDVKKRWAEEDCRRSNRQSGCAMWNVSCFTPYAPAQVFSEQNCSRPGFFQCAAGAYGGYVGCVDGCNTAKDRGQCIRVRCRNQADRSVRPCGSEASQVPGWQEPSGGSPEAQPGSAPWAAKQDSGARVTASATWTAATGDAGVVRGGRRAALPPGQALQPGDEIDTGSGSASVQLAGGHTLQAGPNSRLRLDPGDRTYHLSWGRLLLRFLQLRWRHTVTTNTTVAGIRGTELLVIAQPQAGLDRILVREGTVEVSGRTSGQAVVRGGQQVEVRNGVVGLLRPLSETEWATGTREVGAAPSATDPSTLATLAGTPAAAPGQVGGRDGAVLRPEMNVDRPEGSAYNNFWTNEDWRACAERCAREEQCWSWTWVKPGVQGQVAKCWLKSIIPPAKSNSCCISGARSTAGLAALGCSSLIGTWRSSGGAVITCGPGNECTASNALSGPWRCLEPSGKFEIRWRRGVQENVFIDTFFLSPDGKYLAGTNQYGVAMSAVRE